MLYPHIFSLSLRIRSLYPSIPSLYPRILPLYQREQHYNKILNHEDEPRKHQRERHCSEGLNSVSIGRAERIPCGRDGGEAGHNDEMNRLADPLVHRVHGIAHVQECDVQPCEPQDDEEQAVGCQTLTITC